MRLRAHPPSIARTTHGIPDPVKGSYLPHQASSVRVMEGPVTSQYRWRGVCSRRVPSLSYRRSVACS